MAPEEEELDELMEQIRNLKRKRGEISGDTSRILTEQRQLDQSAIEYLDVRTDRRPNIAAQVSGERMVTCVCGRAVPSEYKHCPHCGKPLD
ncbi:MAG: hypothetical protein GWN18_07910 [Thermoplasmata archaeon]|nr:hypothetical protein [Thermoplasmata archaeon]NIS11505.1 hypothetical protein [Thermoplasmata archaeon]NIS19889.1 hypothetical protein [Thermoplasmata archaeon]NIT77086.1 hypothetical protein [Thermoplasmata archaeon]NIU48998.1 hypothetical protein [Thermoplasmata archaeon]